MKAFLVLMILFTFPGCERRVADPRMKAAKKWLVSEEGRKILAEFSPLPLNDLYPTDQWGVQDVTTREVKDWFLVSAPVRDRNEGVSFALFRYPATDFSGSGSSIFLLPFEDRERKEYWAVTPLTPGQLERFGL